MKTWFFYQFFLNIVFAEDKVTEKEVPKMFDDAGNHQNEESYKKWQSYV